MLESRLLEIAPVKDTFVTNIGSIEILNCCARLTFYVDRNGEREIVQKLVIPIENVPSALAFIVARLRGHWIAQPIAPELLFQLH